MITDWIGVGEVSAERDQNLQNYFYDAGVSSSLVANKSFNFGCRIGTFE